MIAEPRQDRSTQTWRSAIHRALSRARLIGIADESAMPGFLHNDGGPHFRQRFFTTRPILRSRGMSRTFFALLAIPAAALMLGSAIDPKSNLDRHRSIRGHAASPGSIVAAPGSDRPVVAARSAASDSPTIRAQADSSDRFASRVREGSAAAMGSGSANWTNFGGNAQRNGRSGGAGPETDTLLWSNSSDFSIIYWHPVVLEDRVFAIRQSGFPNASGPGDVLVALDLDTGGELWRSIVPYGGDSNLEWIAYVGGADDGRVYAARGGSGRQSPVHAFDAATGALLWSSTHQTLAGPQDGIVFAPDGDLVVGDNERLARIEATDGSTVWSVPRTCAVSGNCGAALGPNAVFIDEPDPTVDFSQSVAKFDLETGALLYRTQPMAGMSVQNAPFVSIDGETVYLARTQNNVATDFLFAFEDTGSALVERWNRPIRWTTSHEHGLADDGSIYTFLPDDQFVKLDPATGEVLASAGAITPLAASISPRTAVGTNGVVYVSNGWANNPALEGRVWAFSGDLSQNLFTLVLDRPNSGGPSLGQDGTLVVADRVGVRAYRDPGSACPADLDGSGVVDGADLAIILAAWGTSGPGDLDGSGIVDGADLAIVLAAWGPCP